MLYSLNNVYPKNGHYVNPSHELYVSIGGPAFTIILSILFLLVIEKYRTNMLTLLYFFKCFFDSLLLCLVDLVYRMKQKYQKF